jgi:hypothetical protein
VLAGVAILASVALVTAYFLVRREATDRPQLEAVTLCPVEGPWGTIVVLLDSTDAFPAVAQTQITQHLIETAEALPDYNLLEIRQVTPEIPGGRILFSKCNPGDGSNLSELTANPELAYRRWLDEFQAPLQDALSGALIAEGADTSPIMATIQQIAVSKFSGGDVEQTPRRLIVVSDMIENTPAYSQYRGDLSYERFRASAGYRDLHTNLHDAGVEILYVQRGQPAVLDASDHLEFWIEWIADNGGRFLAAERLQGVQ